MLSASITISEPRIHTGKVNCVSGPETEPTEQASVIFSFRPSPCRSPTHGYSGPAHKMTLLFEAP
ncbi:hypothetical protein J4Q44_G00179440, partial [Coregonus suidteri]